MLVAQREGNLFDGEAIGFQQLLCPRHPQALMIHRGRLLVMRLEHSRQRRGGNLQILAQTTDRARLGQVLRHPANGQLHAHGWLGPLCLALNETGHGHVDGQVQLLQRQPC